MEILRVFNNNVVLARDDRGRDVVLLGRGVGFKARPGSPVDPGSVARTFVPADSRDPDHIAGLLAEIDPDHVRLVTESLAAAGFERALVDKPTVVIALADHVGFALKRSETGLHVEYPMVAEVINLYPDEYARGLALLKAVNARAPVALPDSEAVALAMHLVNAGFTGGDLAYTYTMTGVIQQMVAIIETTYSIRLDPGSVNLGRFITHLRYLFVRIHDHKQLDDTHSAVGAVIREAYPEALQCAQRLADLTELRLGSPLTDDEVSYLTLHVARLTTPTLP